MFGGNRSLLRGQETAIDSSLRKLLEFADDLCEDSYSSASSDGEEQPAPMYNMELMGRMVEPNKGCHRYDKEECCSKIDGRTYSGYGGQLCVPPTGNTFGNGNECEPANYVSRNYPNQRGECSAESSTNNLIAGYEVEFMDVADIELEECNRQRLMQLANTIPWIERPDLSDSEVQQLCDQAREEYYASERGSPLPIEQALGTEYDQAFVDAYYQGEGPWNLQTETNNGLYELAEDAAVIDDAQELIVEHRRLQDPAWMASCTQNAVMCCFRRDRQANDNNGNCAEEYEENCVDAEPADNTDVCYSEYSRSTRVPENQEADGIHIFRRDNIPCYQINSKDECCQHIDSRYNTIYGGQQCVPSAQGRFTSGFLCEPENFIDGRSQDRENKGYCIGEALGFNIEQENEVHCHGLAWEGEPGESDTATYRANVLFYVAQYDHLYQRGYVENLPGAPMCGCLEEMPVVSRSDCTYPVVEERYVARFDPFGAFIGIQMRDVDIEFNACNGNPNNNLYTYIRDRLDSVDETETAQFLVGPQNNNEQQSNCAEAVEARWESEAAQAMSANQEVNPNSNSNSNNNQASNSVTCEEQYNTIAGGYTCYARILFLRYQQGQTESAARIQVAQEFPNECGACASG